MNKIGTTDFTLKHTKTCLQKISPPLYQILNTDTELVKVLTDDKISSNMLIYKLHRLHQKLLRNLFLGEHKNFILMLQYSDRDA